nr:formimidoylglutamase [uncultured Capnocytophaga sp.]
MSLSYLKPVEELFILDDYKPQQVGFQIQKHLPTLGIPDLTDVKIAFFCIESIENSFQRFRQHLYSLFMGNWNFSIADLGNLPLGDTHDDTHFAIKEIVAELIKQGIIPIVIGGNQEFTYSLYRAFDSLEQMVNLVSVDHKFDFGNDDELFVESSYMSRLISEPPVNLLDFTNLGYQSYYVAQEELDLLEKMCFEAFRLGNIVNDLKCIEPAMRDADIISIDMNSVQAKDMNAQGNVNGFTSREICAISRYAGISSNVQVTGIFNIPHTDLAAQLLAEMIWYFYEGFNFRIKELPVINDENYTKYIVPIDDIQIEFFKSTQTERWWMKPGGDKYSSPQNHIPSGLIPCLPQDYEEAISGTIPERWWRSYRKSV